MATLIIAEKPSMAMDIAKALGGFERRQGYFQCDTYWLTWAIGHVVELSAPEDYFPEWKFWRAATLPMVPLEFSLKPSEKTKSQYNLIHKLLHDHRITDVVNACDAGREGELIFRYIMNLAHCSKPVRRLWISSLTASAIRQGFRHMEERPFNEERFEHLYRAAKCRSEADWLVGINVTRAVTIRQKQKGKQEVYSLGRVQTPTLTLMVRRELEIAAFEPRPYWQVEAVMGTDADNSAETCIGHWFKGEEDKLWSASDTQELLDKLSVSGFPAVGHVLSAQAKTRREAPYLLCDLTSLQREANRRYHFSASRTLKAAQQLYERYKLISYPRTDSRYLTPDLIPSLQRRLRAGKEHSPYEEFVTELLQLPSLPISGRIVNAAKVRDHHALIPTETKVPWQSLSGDARRILELIHQSYVAAFFPDAQWVDREFVSSFEDELFRCKESQLVEAGWRKVYQATEGSSKIPHVEEGQPMYMHSVHAKENVTRPPARYNEGTLLTAMERAGALLDDEELQEAMRDCGLGTAATRAAIIDRLKQVKYVQEQKRELVPTAKGISLVQNLAVDALCSPQLTGEWEAKLASIEKGSFAADRFMSEMIITVSEMTAQCLKAARWQDGEARVTLQRAEKLLEEQHDIEEPDLPKGRVSGARSRKKEADSTSSGEAPEGLGTCPLCGGEVRENRSAFYCSNWRSANPCPLTIWKKVSGKTLTPGQIQALLVEGRTKTLKGFRAKNGAKFDAVLVLQAGKVEMQVQSRQSKASSKAVPKTSDSENSRSQPHASSRAKRAKAEQNEH